MATDVTNALSSKRSQLEQQLASMSELPEENGDISFGKRVGEGTSQAVDRLSAVPAHARLQDMLSEVMRAQQKVEAGTYGQCDVCGETIGGERLEAKAWATRCINHAS